jgi:hypothetical protein
MIKRYCLLTNSIWHMNQQAQEFSTFTLDKQDTTEATPLS